MTKFYDNNYKKKLFIAAIISNLLFIGFLYLIFDLSKPIDNWPWRPPLSQHLIFGTISDPTDIDPHLCYDTASQDVISQICEGLYKFDTTDPSYPLLPVLASDLPSVNGLEITIPLRLGVYFQDMTPCKAIAAKWNFDRLNYFLNYSGNKFLPAPFNVSLNATQQIAKFASLFTMDDLPIINRTEIIDTYTIKIILNNPKASFINLLTYPATFFLSPTSAQNQGKELDYLTYTDGDVLIGSGPFKFQSYLPNVQVKFTCNDNYWQGPPYLVNLTFKIIQNEMLLNAALFAGSIDLYNAPHPAFLDLYRTDPNITLLEAGPTLDINYMGFNGYMVNTTFRKAISYAVNYSYCIDVILEGNAYRLKSPIPRGITMSNYTFNYVTFDRAYAQSIMQSMGYGVGFTTDTQWLAVADAGGWGFDWNITTQIEEPKQIDLAMHISNSLKYLGINTTIIQIAFLDLISCMEHDVGPLRRDLIPMYMLGWTPDYLDPGNYIKRLYSNTSSIWVNTWDHELEMLILAGETIVDPVARRPIYNQIQQKLVEELYFSVWITSGKNYDVYQKYVHGWIPNAINRLDFYHVYLY